MLKELRFVMGSISKMSHIPAMTHFKIGGGFVRGYNGALALCAPLAMDIECSPEAEPLVKALARCTETIHLAMTKAGRLSVRSGPFKALINCIDGETPHVMPEGSWIDLDGEALLEAVKVVSPVISDDASKPWATGLLLRGSSAFATNNISLVEYYTGANFPELNIPRKAINEILRLGEAPVKAQCSEMNLTLHYADGRWLRTQLIDARWPDIAPIMEREAGPLIPLPEGFFDAVRALTAFTGDLGLLIFEGDTIMTHREADEGATFEVEGLNATGVYSAAMLLRLEGLLERIDWSGYPKPALFQGPGLRGAIVGARI